LISPLTSKDKRPILIPAFIDIPLVPEVKVLAPEESEDYISYPDSTIVDSPVYISCKSEEHNPHFPFPPFSYFLSPNGQFPEPPSLHPKAVERCLAFYENPLFNSQSSSPGHQMVVVGGGGVGGGARGASGVGEAGGQGPPPLPLEFFPKWQPDTLL
jgi:hypothetical protein